MEFRIATTRDSAALAELRWTWRVEEKRGGELLEESRSAYLSRFVAFMEDGLRNRWTAWVADDGGRVASTIWVYRVPKVPSPGRPSRDFGYVTNVYTVPEQRGRGVGAQLLAAVTQWAHETGLEMLIVWPSDRSLDFYARQGFAPSQEMHELDVVGYDG
ncbi:MAG TPA: GNAT family N-acetyltransferase [Acidimicrobiales bacterium]|nr:GNAT family N-acetyltransferase [Acidimicrobiales bacterium]